MNKICSLISTLLALIWLIMAPVGLTACKPEEQTLSFETIAQSDLINYREEAPTILVIAKGEDVDGLTETVLAEDLALADQLRQLDYSRFLAILALQGRKGSSGYSVTVQRITRAGDQVNVQAKFVEPAQDSFRLWVSTSPYHLIAVSKEVDWGQQIHFALVVSDEPVAETTNLIP